MQGVGSQAHYMYPESYTPAHPHDNESIIYTVKGRWVLCSSGKRNLMKERSLFHFAPNTETGFEVPFDEPAFLLIFKGDVLFESEAMLEYLHGEMQERLQSQVGAGQVFMLKDLPEDHPARVFAAAQGWKAE